MSDELIERVAEVLGASWRDGWANRPNDLVLHHLAAALLPLIREREAAAWEEAVRAVAWLLDNGEPSAFAALAYTAKNNPYAGSEGA